MRLNELIKDFSIATSNEEKEVLEKCKELKYLNSFTEREKFVIENLIRKHLITKVKHNDTIMVLTNDL
jgi:hypothetical protein